MGVLILGTPFLYSKNIISLLKNLIRSDMNRFFKFIVFILFFLLFGCGGSDKLNIKGDPEAIKLAESMLKELGGKKAWSRIKSVYIRTIATASSQQSYVLEEWINLDRPKFMNIKTTNNIQSVDIIDGNDGWRITGRQIQMIPPQRITSYLEWYDTFFIRLVKFMAEERDNIEVRKKGDRQFEFYIDGTFKSGFELYDTNLPSSYYVEDQYGNYNTVFFEEFSEYKGYKFPLTIKGESLLATYNTDYFDPSHLEAEKAFSITFNPNVLLENLD